MKKLLSLILAGAMAAGMTVASFAATVDKSFKIDTVKEEALQLDANSDVDKVSPSNKTLKIQLTGDMFTWKDSKGNIVEAGVEYKKDTNGKVVVPYEKETTAGAGIVLIPAKSNVTESQLRSAKVTVKSTVAKGSSVIDSVKIDSDKNEAFIKISFVEPFVSTKDVDFDFTVYLLENKSRVDETKINLAGTYKNEVITVDAADDEVYTGDNRIVEATEYIKDIKVDLGNDFYISTKMFQDKKYYGIATNEPDASDDAMLSKYPEIEVVYTIKQVGLNGGVATFDLGDKYYVYDKDGKYLGTTADKLAVSDKYYLTSKKIDIATSEEVEEEVEEEAKEEETTPNENNNPETGVNGMVNVAVVAGVVALAAAGAVALKK